MSEDLKVIVENYKVDDEIVNKLGLDVENVLEFDVNGRYIFLHYGKYGMPMLGHRVEKCRQMDGTRYDKIIVEVFEDQIKKIDGFRKIVNKHIEKGEERKAGI